MELFNTIVDFIQSPAGSGLFIALFAASEALALIPGVQANSIFQLVTGVLAKFAKKAPAV